jgi:hypothetical protein
MTAIKEGMMKVIVDIFIGLFLLAVGGWALGMAVWLCGDGQRLSEPALEGLGVIFGFVALPALAIGAAQFIWLYKKAKSG